MYDSKAKKPAAKNGKATRKRSSAGRRSTPDAIALLKSDHRQVEEWFQQFQKARSDTRKTDLAAKICTALKVHTSIEEELFYPAFLEATGEKDLHHEAEVEHEGAKRLIADIEKSGPDDDWYDAKLKVLSEMIKHHVKEEEKRDGMFAKARQSDMDLKALGEQLAQRKQDLMAAPAGKSPPRRSAGARGMLRVVPAP